MYPINLSISGQKSQASLIFIFGDIQRMTNVVLHASESVGVQQKYDYAYICVQEQNKVWSASVHPSCI